MATNAVVEHRVNELERALLEIARLNEKTARSQDRHSEHLDRHSEHLDRLTEKLDHLTAQNDRTALGLDRLSAEMREFKDEMAEFKEEMRAFKDETKSANAELRASMDRQNAEQKADLNHQNAKLSDTLGTLAEDIVGPSIPTLFKRYFPGHEPEFDMRTLRRHRVTGQRREFDTPAWNDQAFLFTETKSRLRPTDLDELAETIADVRNYFPEAAGKSLFAGLASLYIDPSLVTAGERRGYLMIALGNDLAEVLNSEGFKPKEF